MSLSNDYTLTIRNRKYEATLPFDIDDLRRDKSGQLQSRAGELAQRAITFPNSLISTLISNGEAGTSGLCYDGQFFFDTDHNESGSNQTNDLTSTEVPSANVSNADNPTPDEAASIIMETVSHMMFYTDDQGEPINQDAQAWDIHVGNAMYAAALRQAIGLKNLDTGSGTRDNPVGALNGWSFRVISNPRLSSTADKLYFLRRDAVGVKSFIMQEELPITPDLLGPDSDEAFKNDRVLYGVKWVGAGGYGRWNHGALVTLS